MRIDKETVADKLRSDGDYDRAQQAECVLPRHVDTERDVGLLTSFDVNVSELEAEAGD